LPLPFHISMFCEKVYLTNAKLSKQYCRSKLL
jgi:hypothetical protein